MKALSIRMPWAWLILRPDITRQNDREWQHGVGIKDIENRTWKTKFRGRVIVHAGQAYTRAQHEYDAGHLLREYRIELPPCLNLQERSGALLGEVDIVDCVSEHKSRWFCKGSYGLVLANPTPYRHPVPYKGMLGFFEVPDDVVAPPKHCSKCGLGMGEYMACEEPDCGELVAGVR